MLDPAIMVWTDLSEVVRGARPFPRVAHGFISSGQFLYLHGGDSGFFGVFGANFK